MARKPLHIPWNVLMSDTEGPAPTVEIVPSGGAAATGSDPGRQGGNLSGETFSLEGLTDHELEEKIERVRKLIASEVKARLLDKGAKLQANLQGLEKELEWRRSLPRANKDKDEEGSREIKQLIGRSPTDSSQKLSPDASSSNSGCFAHHFSKLLDAKVDHANQDAFNEELSVMCKGHSTGFNEIDRKRRKSLESHGSLALKLRKQAIQVLDVVVLDEDAQAVEPMQEQDDTIERLTSPTKEAKIFYPSRDHPECVEIFQSDIKCLEPASYLSSTIMNFYIQYLQNSVAFSEKPKGEYHFCNTYFYSKLEEAISHKGEVDKHLAKLRRWWKGINIFDKAYIFLPIHKDMHWSLVIICIPDREDESGPIILHLDSLGFHASRMIFGNIESCCCNSHTGTTGIVITAQRVLITHSGTTGSENLSSPQLLVPSAPVQGASQKGDAVTTTLCMVLMLPVSIADLYLHMHNQLWWWCCPLLGHAVEVLQVLESFLPCSSSPTPTPAAHIWSPQKSEQWSMLLLTHVTMPAAMITHAAITTLTPATDSGSHSHAHVHDDWHHYVDLATSALYKAAGWTPCMPLSSAPLDAQQHPPAQCSV